MSCGGGEGGWPTCQLSAMRGLVEEPVAVHVMGNAATDMRSLPAGLGKTQRPVDRGAGGNRCQSACPCGTRRLPPTRPPFLPGRAYTRSSAEDRRKAVDLLPVDRVIGQQGFSSGYCRFRPYPASCKKTSRNPLPLRTESAIASGSSAAHMSGKGHSWT